MDDERGRTPASVVERLSIVGKINACHDELVNRVQTGDLVQFLLIYSQDFWARNHVELTAYLTALRSRASSELELTISED
jgi:hypothetical protein